MFYDVITDLMDDLDDVPPPVKLSIEIKWAVIHGEFTPEEGQVQNIITYFEMFGFSPNPETQYGIIRGLKGKLYLTDEQEGFKPEIIAEFIPTDFR
jgi:hypothetical protein